MPGYFPLGGNQNFSSATFLAFARFTTFNEQDFADVSDNVSGIRNVMPYDGYVSHVTLRSNGTHGDSAKLNLCKVGSGTDLDDMSANEVTGDVLSDMSTANTAARFNFGKTFSFSAGDGIAFKFTPSAPPGSTVDIDGMLVCIFNTNS